MTKPIKMNQTKTNNISYASRAKGIMNKKHTNNNNGIINQKRSNSNKPRKPPRPHHTTSSTSQSPEIRTVIDELLAETKTINIKSLNNINKFNITPPNHKIKLKTKTKTRPRNFSDPVMIDKNMLKIPASPDTVNTTISSQSTNSNISTGSSNTSNSKN